MKQSYITECIDDIIEDNDCNVLEAIGIFLELEIRDLFNMGAFDQPDQLTKCITYDDKCYQIDIKEDGCCEATHDHRIMYWSKTIVEIENPEEKKNMTLNEFATLLRQTLSFNRSYERLKNMAKDNGLVIVYAASDDLLEFEGAISEEICIDYDENSIVKYDLSNILTDLKKDTFILTASLDTDYVNFVNANFKCETVVISMRGGIEQSVMVVFDLKNISSPKLIFETETIRKVEDDQLEHFIKTVYGHSVCIASATEWDCNCWNELTADPTEDLPKYQNDNWKCWIDNGTFEYWTLDLIMNDLARRNLLEAGSYLCRIIH